ncbi:MAG: hypothetical protein IJ645_08985 [Ruminococcus sp.]|nr:hypothetical protein [Ruminococcus sp.]
MSDLINWDWILYNLIYRVFYIAEIAICQIVEWEQQLFNVFSGISTVKYGNDEMTLIDVFFRNKAVSGVFLGMSAIGIVLAFVFAIISVTRKALDLDDKVKMSHGQILRNLLKSILFIVGLNLFMTITVTATNVILDQVVYVFDNAEALGESSDDHIDFTNEQFAAMSRIFNTVGNYSINQSSKNRYNLNVCYNEIRGDIQYLANTGVLDYYYETKENGKVVTTWQSMIMELASAADYTTDVPVDVYNEGIANALNHCMTVLKTDRNFKALKSYDRIQVFKDSELNLDKTLFLIGTMGIPGSGAAKNEAYNQSPSIYDNIRLPYLLGDKSIYDLDTVNQDFDIALFKTNYTVIYLAGIFVMINMAIILVTCVVRIFNLIFLYVIGPPFFGTISLDEGGKARQWLTAFIIQSFTVFATVISMRLFLIFVPIVLDPKLQLASNTYLDIIGKLVFISAGVLAINKANGLLTGILADQAGHQAVLSGDVSSDVQRVVSAGENLVMGALGVVGGGIGNVLGASLIKGSEGGGGGSGEEKGEEDLPDKDKTSSEGDDDDDGDDGDLPDKNDLSNLGDGTGYGSGDGTGGQSGELPSNNNNLGGGTGSEGLDDGNSNGSGSGSGTGGGSGSGSGGGRGSGSHNTRPSAIDGFSDEDRNSLFNDPNYSIDDNLESYFNQVAADQAREEEEINNDIRRDNQRLRNRYGIDNMSRPRSVTTTRPVPPKRGNRTNNTTAQNTGNPVGGSGALPRNGVNNTSVNQPNNLNNLGGTGNPLPNNLNSVNPGVNPNLSNPVRQGVNAANNAQNSSSQVQQRLQNYTMNNALPRTNNTANRTVPQLVNPVQTNNNQPNSGIAQNLQQRLNNNDQHLPNSQNNNNNNNN